jgi:hypothetical protein
VSSRRKERSRVVEQAESGWKQIGWGEPRHTSRDTVLLALRTGLIH